MGEHSEQNMKYHLLVVLALCAYAMSSEVLQFDEAHNEAVEMGEAYSFIQSPDEAQQKVDELLALGTSQDGCRKLVTDSRDAITASVKASQKTLESMPKGKACKDTYTALMQIHKDAQEKAARKIVDAKSAKSKIDNQKIPFDAVALNVVHDELGRNECSRFHGPNFKAAKAAQKAAAAMIVAAEEAAKILAKLHKSEERAARGIMNACLCKTKTDLLNAFKKAKEADPATNKAWAFADSVECVLDRKTTSQCNKEKKIAPLALKMPLATDFAEKYDCKKGALDEIARRSAKRKKIWNAGEPKRAAARAVLDGAAAQQSSAMQSSANAIMKRCQGSVANCQPGRVKCEALGMNCRGGYTYGSGVCRKPAGYSSTNRVTPKYYAWTNCCDGCQSGEQCAGRKYFDATNSNSECTCKATKYTPADTYVIYPNTIVGKCQACNSGFSIDASGQCQWNTVCQTLHSSSSRHFGWTNCCNTCPGGYSCGGKSCHDLTCSSSTCACSRHVCKRCPNCGYN